MIRDIEPKANPDQFAKLSTLLERARRVYTQQRTDRNKLYAMHAPEVECIGKGKARQPNEFGVKVGIGISAKAGLILGARAFPGNPYDGEAQVSHAESAEIMTGVKPKRRCGVIGRSGSLWCLTGHTQRLSRALPVVRPAVKAGKPNSQGLPFNRAVTARA